MENGAPDASVSSSNLGFMSLHCAVCALILPHNNSMSDLLPCPMWHNASHSPPAPCVGSSGRSLSLSLSYCPEASTRQIDPFSLSTIASNIHCYFSYICVQDAYHAHGFNHHCLENQSLMSKLQCHLITNKVRLWLFVCHWNKSSSNEPISPKHNENLVTHSFKLMTSNVWYSRPATATDGGQTSGRLPERAAPNARPCKASQRAQK